LFPHCFSFYFSKGAADCLDTASIPPFNGDFCFIINRVLFDGGASHLNTITVVIDGFDDRIVEGTESFTTTAVYQLIHL